MDVEHNPRVTGDEPGSCSALTGSQYQGRSTADGWCDAASAGAASARRPARAVREVTGDTPLHGDTVTGIARGAGRDITGTPYHAAVQAGSAAPARAYATQACRTWQSSASQDSAVGSGTIKEAAAQAETSAGLDPTWGTLASAMVFVASLPETGNSPTDVAKSNADLATIESQCSGLGVTISN